MIFFFFFFLSILIVPTVCLAACAPGNNTDEQTRMIPSELSPSLLSLCCLSPDKFHKLHPDGLSLVFFSFLFLSRCILPRVNRVCRVVSSIDSRMRHGDETVMCIADGRDWRSDSFHFLRKRRSCIYFFFLTCINNANRCSDTESTRSVTRTVTVTKVDRTVQLTLNSSS